MGVPPPPARDFFNIQAPSYSSLHNSTHLFMFWMFRKLWHRSIKKKYKYTSEKPDRVLVLLKSTATHSRARILSVCNALVRGGEWRDGSAWRVVIAGRACKERSIKVVRRFVWQIVNHIWRSKQGRNLARIYVVITLTWDQAEIRPNLSGSHTFSLTATA